MNQIRKQMPKISTVLMLIAVFLGGFLLGNQNTSSQAQDATLAIGTTDEAFAPLFEVYETIQARYVDADTIDTPALVNGAISGMVDALDDPFSSYLDPSSFEMFQTDLSGDVEGIGVVIRTDEETEQVYVVEVLEGTGAERAGVLPGDIFIDVDGQSVDGLNQSELAALVRGPSGTEVVITFLRGEELVTLTITRMRFEVPNVTYEVLDGDIAYISMNEFSDRSRGQLDAALEELDVNSRAGLIFDLRGNPGGLLSSAIDVASAFIPDGVVLYEAFGDGSEQVFESNGDFAGITVPIVVLVNEGSASASELVSGAMQDRGVATLIGEVTFGKGTVQTLQPLSNNGALRITIARYLLPTRRWIHEVGVTPDIVIPYDPATDGLDIDPQLDAALEFFAEGAQ